MSFTSINPTTGEVVKQYPAHSADEIEAALASAAKAFQQWRAASFAERAVLMNAAAQLLENELAMVAELLTTEMGKTFVASKGEVTKCVGTMRYYAEHAESMLAEESIASTATRSGIRYEPLGAVLAVMP
jgi:succinate-semialdehyde dehydrogenase/glutarate-semialdehyde dehydrogenase